MYEDFIVFDLEADGLLPEAATIWCGSFYELDNDKTLSFSPKNKNPDYIGAMLDYIQSTNSYLVGQNIIEYDRPLIEKITGYRIPLKRLIDTLKLSKMVFADIKGGHSIEAWGERFGIKKPEHEDWSQFSDEMLYRNQQDVVINTKLFQLIQQKGFKIDD